MRMLLGIAASALLLASSMAGAHEYKVGQITIDHPWSRATPPGAEVGGGYLRIENAGTEDDVLLSATAEIAESVAIHETSVADGIASMRPVEGGLAVPAGASIVLEPGAAHLMFMHLARPLKEGERFAGTLTFDKAGSVDIEFDVGPLAGSAHDHAGGGEQE